MLQSEWAELMSQLSKQCALIHAGGEDRILAFFPLSIPSPSATIREQISLAAGSAYAFNFNPAANRTT